MTGGTKQNGRPVPDARREEFENDLLGCGSHVDAGQLERLAIYRALHCNVMAGVRCHLVLRVDNVHLLVGVVHEHVLGAMFFDALGRALSRTSLVVCALDSTLAVGNPAGPRAIRRHGERSSEQHCCHCHCKSYFHDLPLQKSIAIPDTPGRPLAWHSSGPVSRLFLRPCLSSIILSPLNGNVKMSPYEQGDICIEPERATTRGRYLQMREGGVGVCQSRRTPVPERAPN